VRWVGAKPASGVQAAAREARYALLAEAAAGAGPAAVLVGHTADDVAETLLARLARGSGLAGLAAMRAWGRIAAGPSDPVLLARPLLGFDRDAVDATLAAAGVRPIEDPSNDDEAFERVRARRVLKRLEAEGLVRRRAIALAAARLRGAADAEDRRIDAALGRATASPDGAFDVAPDDWAAIGPDERPGVLARLLFAAGGGAAPVPPDAAAAALADVEARGAAVCAGALARLGASGLSVVREPAALLGRAGVPPLAPLSIAPGDAVLWDRRFIAAAPPDGPALVLRAAGPGAPERLRAAPALQTVDGRAVAGVDADAGVWRPAPEGVRLDGLALERAYGGVLRFPAAPVAGR